MAEKEYPKHPESNAFYGISGADTFRVIESSYFKSKFNQTLLQ